MHCPSHSSQFYHPKNTGWGVQIIMLLIVSFSPLPSYLLGPNILLNILFSNTLSLRSSLNLKDQFSHPYKTAFFTLIIKHCNWTSPCLYLCTTNMYNKYRQCARTIRSQSFIKTICHSSLFQTLKHSVLWVYVIHSSSSLPKMLQYTTHPTYLVEFYIWCLILLNLLLECIKHTH
jgi:hypothetical protein